MHCIYVCTYTYRHMHIDNNLIPLTLISQHPMSYIKFVVLGVVGTRAATFVVICCLSYLFFFIFFINNHLWIKKIYENKISKNPKQNQLEQKWDAYKDFFNVNYSPQIIADEKVNHWHLASQMDFSAST